jgi:hypothetical protein
MTMYTGVLPVADLSSIIETEAALPASSTDDGQSATARSLADLIATDKYLAQKRANASRRKGIVFNVLTTPGALDDGGRGGCSLESFGGN